VNLGYNQFIQLADRYPNGGKGKKKTDAKKNNAFHLK
jgi:hypothetical protein